MKKENNQITILSFKIHNYSINEIVKKIDFYVSDKGKSHYILVANLNHLAKIQYCEFLRKVYDGASLVLSDGRYIYWLSKILGTPLKEYIRGLDLFYAICKLASQKGYKTLMVGGRPGAVEISKSILEKKFHGLKICKTFFYPLGSIEEHNSLNTVIIEDINKYNIDILFLGLGTPREQEWIYKYKNQIRCVVICVGSVYDFISKKIKESPPFLQKIGFEWFWRLLSEPRRLWRRYLIENMHIVLLIFKDLLKNALIRKKRRIR